MKPDNELMSLYGAGKPPLSPELLHKKPDINISRKDLSEIERLKPDNDELHHVKNFSRKKNMWQKARTKNIVRLSFGILGRQKLKKFPEYSYIITMYFTNGISKTWVIKTLDGKFKVKGKTYYIYGEECWFDISLNQYHLYYDERHSCPINRELHVDKSAGSEPYRSVTPSIMSDLIKMEFVRNLVKTRDNTKIWLWIMGGIIVVLLLVIIAKQFGWVK